MDWIWISGAIFSVWAVLRVIGAERQRRIQELTIQIGAQKAEEPRRGARPSAAAPTSFGAAAVRSKPTR